MTLPLTSDTSQVTHTNAFGYTYQTYWKRYRGTMKYLLIIRYHLMAWSIWQPWPQMPWYLTYKRAERYFSSYDLHVTRCASTFEDSRLLHSYPCHTNSYAPFCDSFLPTNIYHHFATRIKCKMDTIFRRHVQINMLVENIIFYLYSCVCF